MSSHEIPLREGVLLPSLEDVDDGPVPSGVAPPRIEEGNEAT